MQSGAKDPEQTDIGAPIRRARTFDVLLAAAAVWLICRQLRPREERSSSELEASAERERRKRAEKLAKKERKEMLPPTPNAPKGRGGPRL